MTAATACRTCGSELREGARFCDGCGAPVTEQDTRAEYKQVTVLFADVVHCMDIAAAVGPERLGIATGEAELRGADYFGAVLNRAARVMAAGHGGQILVAESTAGLLSGVDLVDLGPRRLRDLPPRIFRLRGSPRTHRR